MVEHLPLESMAYRSVRRYTTTERLLEALLQEHRALLDQYRTFETRQRHEREKFELPDADGVREVEVDPRVADDFAANVLTPHRRARKALDPPRG